MLGLLLLVSLPALLLWIWRATRRGAPPPTVPTAAHDATELATSTSDEHAMAHGCDGDDEGGAAPVAPDAWALNDAALAAEESKLNALR